MLGSQSQSMSMDRHSTRSYGVVELVGATLEKMLHHTLRGPVAEVTGLSFLIIPGVSI